MARLAAGLSGDSRDFTRAEIHDMRREQLIGHEHQRPGDPVGLRGQHLGKVPANPHDHIPHVRQPLAEVLVLGPREQARIFLQDLVQRIGGGFVARRRSSGESSR